MNRTHIFFVIIAIQIARICPSNGQSTFNQAPVKYIVQKDTQIFIYKKPGSIKFALGQGIRMIKKGDTFTFIYQVVKEDTVKAIIQEPGLNRKQVDLKRLIIEAKDNKGYLKPQAIYTDLKNGAAIPFDQIKGVQLLK